MQGCFICGGLCAGSHPQRKEIISEYAPTMDELELIRESLHAKKNFTLMGDNNGAISDLGYRALVWKGAEICAKSNNRKTPSTKDVMNSKKAVDSELKKHGVGRDYGDFS